MYIFTINATDAFGNKKAVQIKAENPNSAIKLLKEEGFRAVTDDITDIKKDSFLAKLQEIDFDKYFSRVSQKDILRLIKMIGNSIRRGRTLKDTLNFVGENEDSKALKNVIIQLRDRMDKPFVSQVEIFGTLPQHFDEEFLGIIEAGETSSNIGEYLIDYVEEKKKQMALSQKFNNVLISRGMTFLMVIGVALVVILFVIPQFQQLFGDKMEIPWAMNILLQTSEIAKKYGIYIAVALVLSITTVSYLIMNNKSVRWWWHDFLLHMPVLGKTLRTFYTAQFAYLLSTLLTKNVNIIKSMDIIITQTKNVCMVTTYKNLVKGMQGGDDLFSSIIKENEEGRDYLISSIVQAAKLGGETASLGSTLLDVRNDLDELFVMRLERAIKGFSMIFYAIIIACAVFIAYSIGGAIMAFYENAQNLI